MPSPIHKAAPPCGSGIASSRFNAAARSLGHGFGCNACTAALASTARTGCSGGGASSEASGAVVTRIICRSSRSASARISIAAVCRRLQSRAAAQPSSTMRAMGPAPARRFCGLSKGCANARMTSAAKTVRNRISHHGVRAGVSSRGVRPNSSRIAGKTMRRGAGGVTRNSHQITGNAASAASSQGDAKASEPSASIRYRRRSAVSAACNANSARCGGRSVR